MKYNLMITEHLCRTVRVEADSAEDAFQKVESLLAEGKIALASDDLCDRDVQTLDDYEYDRCNYGTHLTTDETYEVDDDFTGETA